MRAGKLDRRIRLERKSVTYSASGEPQEGWATLATRWAEARPLRGTERFSDPQLIAKGFTTFRLRWSGDVAGVTPLDRVIFGGRIYDVAGVRELGRRVGIEIDAVVRADVEEDVDFAAALDFTDGRNAMYVGQVI